MKWTHVWMTFDIQIKLQWLLKSKFSSLYRLTSTSVTRFNPNCVVSLQRLCRSVTLMSILIIVTIIVITRAVLGPLDTRDMNRAVINNCLIQTLNISTLHINTWTNKMTVSVTNIVHNLRSAVCLSQRRQMMNDSCTSVQVTINRVNTLSAWLQLVCLLFAIFLKQLESSPVFCSQLNTTATRAQHIKSYSTRAQHTTFLARRLHSMPLLCLDSSKT